MCLLAGELCWAPVRYSLTEILVLTTGAIPLAVPFRRGISARLKQGHGPLVNAAKPRYRCTLLDTLQHLESTTFCAPRALTTTSMPERSSPNTTCLLSKRGAGANVIKNCDPLVCEPAREHLVLTHPAIATWFVSAHLASVAAQRPPAVGDG